MDWLISTALAAQATEATRSPLSYSLVTWAWVIGISAAGGLANFHRRLRDGVSRPFNFMELTGEVFVSAFAGAVTFLLCEFSGANQLLTAALCGLVGHMGSRAIFLAEAALERYSTAKGWKVGP